MTLDKTNVLAPGDPNPQFKGVDLARSVAPHVNLVNVRVPNGVTPGPSVPVHMVYLGRPSNVVIIAIQ